jgi:anti-sigma regulatory factor (Ser/Thr protein kinase)
LKLPSGTLQLPSESASVTVARKAMAEVAREAGAPAADVELAVSEAVSNAVTHAFRDREPGTITITASLDGGRLNIEVSDDGGGMAPNLDSQGLGFGLSLITKMTSEVRFDSSGEGTTVAMAFPIAERGQLA